MHGNGFTIRTALKIRKKRIGNLLWENILPRHFMSRKRHDRSSVYHVWHLTECLENQEERGIYNISDNIYIISETGVN